MDPKHLEHSALIQKRDLWIASRKYASEALAEEARAAWNAGATEALLARLPHPAGHPSSGVDLQTRRQA